MSPLRNNLENARREYESTRYRGNLALDVLGPDAVGHEASPMRITPARRRFFAPLAIAAALVIGLGVGIFAGRATRSTTPEIANDVHTSTQLPPTTPTTLPTTQPKPAVTPMPKTVVATNSPTNTSATATEDFTLVPSAASFSDQAVSVVPNLAALESEANAQNSNNAADNTSSSTAVASTDAVSAAPMSLLLLSVDEYSDQQAAADAKTKSTSKVPNTSSAEDRS